VRGRFQVRIVQWEALRVISLSICLGDVRVILDIASVKLSLDLEGVPAVSIV
jgi:hypothetical protein